MQAVALSPAVREQLSADACAHSFALSGTGVLNSLRCVLSGDTVSDGRLLGRQLCNPVLELLYHGAPLDRLDLNLIKRSALSIEALDAVLAGGSFSVKSEDELLKTLLSLGKEYRPLLRWVEMRFLSVSGLAALAEHLGSPAEWAWGGIAGRAVGPASPTRASARFCDHFRLSGDLCAFPQEAVCASVAGWPRRFRCGRLPPLLRRPRKHSDCDFGHEQEHLRRLHSSGVGVSAGPRQVQSRYESEKFPFHAEESAQPPAAEICVDGRKEGRGNLV
jgi:hypothetical protein